MVVEETRSFNLQPGVWGNDIQVADWDGEEETGGRGGGGGGRINK